MADTAEITRMVTLLGEVRAALSAYATDGLVSVTIDGQTWQRPQIAELRRWEADLVTQINIARAAEEGADFLFDRVMLLDNTGF